MHCRGFSGASPGQDDFTFVLELRTACIAVGCTSSIKLPSCDMQSHQPGFGRTLPCTFPHSLGPSPRFPRSSRSSTLPFRSCPLPRLTTRTRHPCHLPSLRTGWTAKMRAANRYLPYQEIFALISQLLAAVDAWIHARHAIRHRPAEYSNRKWKVGAKFANFALQRVVYILGSC